MSADVRDEEPVPKLPRGRGIRLSKPELVRISFTVIALIGVILLTRPCANAMSNFVTGFDQGSAKRMPKPGTVEPQQYEQLKPGMTEQEIKDAIERAKARSGSGTGTGSGTGSGGAATRSGSAH